MGMRFEELNEATRSYMLSEFDDEQRSGSPFVGSNLSSAGREVFAQLVRAALEDGSDDTLIAAFGRPDLWASHSIVRRKDGSSGERRINVGQQARLLGLSEFNTWYVRGLASRLLDEGVPYCEIYRAQDPIRSPSQECLAQEGQRVPVRHVYDGHRARYWPRGDPSAFSVPIVPNCHHTIRRC